MAPAEAAGEPKVSTFHLLACRHNLFLESWCADSDEMLWKKVLHACSLDAQKAKSLQGRRHRPRRSRKRRFVPQTAT